ncbi:MAG: site-specific DNA-methyltransferase, partial [Synechococcus sp. SB0676_bin_10]|nr:site-specific DNA-methyltransferase [Synechococcus sp. SB0676_bin_10]
MPAANFASATIWTGDNLDIMRGMNSACVDLIYLDPPFNSNRTYEAPIGSKAAGASFKDAWTLDDVDVCEHGELADRNPAAYAVIDAARQAHGKGMQSYLVFMAVRLLEMQRILKPAGSIYLHCDPTASHYLKLLMDGIFGKDRFRNEIIWSYRTGGVSKNYFARKHDVLFYYSGGSMFNMQTEKAYTKSKNRKPGLVNYGAGQAMFYEDDNGIYNLVSMRDVWEIPY